MKPNLRTLYEDFERRNALLARCEMDEETRAILAQPCPLLKQAEQAAESGDVETLLMVLDNEAELAFVLDNIKWLKFLGKYEAALVSAFTATRSNNAGWSLSVLKFLFNIADRDKLRAAGDPLPRGDVFTLYRGVAGIGKRRKPSGPSWTADIGRAKFFAMRYPRLEDPAIYTAKVRRDDVLLYYNQRKEQEFVVFVNKPKRLK